MSREPSRAVVDIVQEVSLGVPVPWLRALARRTIVEVAPGVGLRGPLEMALLSVGRERIRELNQSHRKRPEATDVLSFPLQESGDLGPLLGDVVICPAVARENARRARRPYRTEIGVLLIHGILHLLGYDHETDRGQMRHLERTLWERLGFRRLGRQELS